MQRLEFAVRVPPARGKRAEFFELGPVDVGVDGVVGFGFRGGLGAHAIAFWFCLSPTKRRKDEQTTRFKISGLASMIRPQPLLPNPCLRFQFIDINTSQSAIIQQEFTRHPTMCHMLSASCVEQMRFWVIAGLRFNTR